MSVNIKGMVYKGFRENNVCKSSLQTQQKFVVVTVSSEDFWISFPGHSSENHNHLAFSRIVYWCGYNPQIMLSALLNVAFFLVERDSKCIGK